MPCARSFPGNSPLPFPCRAKPPILSGRRISSSNSTESGRNRGRHAHRFRTRFPNNAGQMPCIVKQIFDFKPGSSVYREERGAWIVLRYYPFIFRQSCNLKSYDSICIQQVMVRKRLYAVVRICFPSCQTTPVIEYKFNKMSRFFKLDNLFRMTSP